MTDHERVLQLAAISLDFELTPDEQAELEAHLADCPPCRATAAAFRGDQAALAALPRFDAPERVRRAVLVRSPPGRSSLAFAARAIVAAALVIAPLALAVLALRDPNLRFGIAAGPPGEVAPSIDWRRVDLPQSVDGERTELHAVTALPGDGVVAVGLACTDLTSPSGCEARSAVSVDGDTWSLASPQVSLTVEPLPGGRWAGMRDVVSAGAQLVAVGATGDGGRPRAAVWLSSDGLDWERVPDDPAFAAAWMNAVVALDDGTLLAVGGAATASGARAATWTSADGRAWKRAPDDPGMDVGSAETLVAGRPVAGMWDVVAGADGLTAVGAACPPGQAECIALAWTSPDGRTWTRLPDATLGSGSTAVVIPLDGALVALGRRGIGGATWRSMGDDPWTLRALPPARSGGLLAAVHLGSRLIAGGSPGAERSGVWVTSDGSTWTLERGELFDGATVLGLATAGDLVVAVGASEADHGLIWIGREIDTGP